MLMLLRSVHLASSANTALYHFSTIIHFPFYPHTPRISNKNRKLIIQCRNTFLLSLHFVCFFCCTSSTSLTISRRFTLLSSSFSLHLSVLIIFSLLIVVYTYTYLPLLFHAASISTTAASTAAQHTNFSPSWHCDVKLKCLVKKKITKIWNGEHTLRV